MRCQRPLPVGGSLHRPEHLFEVPPQAPRVWAGRFCQTHLAEHGEPCNIMSHARPRRFANAACAGFRDTVKYCDPTSGLASFRSLRSIEVSRFSLTSRRSASTPSSSVR